MKIKLLLIISAFCLFISPVVFAQEEQDSTKVENDSTFIADDWQWDENWNWDDWDAHFDIWNDWRQSSPSISLHYGLSEINIDGFNEDFQGPGFLELKLGYELRNQFSVDSSILKYKYKYIFLSNFSTQLSGNENSNGLDTKAWRFGYGENHAYGYDLGDVEILPYSGFSLNWTRLYLQDSAMIPVNQEYLDLWNESFRFGTSAEGGVRINIAKHFAVDAGYERAIAFPRHLFWKWAGSAVIEAIGNGLLDEFINEIMDSSPYAGPIVNFVLKNVLSYGMYELRQEKMNWPFNSAPPLSYDQFKFGVTFSF